MDRAEEVKVAGVATASAAGSIDALLALQEVADATNNASKGRQRAAELLDRLEEVRLALLTGSLPRQSLDALGRMVRARRDDVFDPRLRSVLDEIELRAAVELEKLAYGQPGA